MGFSAERGSWAWRGREASCSPKTTQNPCGAQAAFQAGQELWNTLLSPSQAGHGRSIHTLLHLLCNKSVHKHLCVHVLRPVCVQALSSVGTDIYKHPVISVSLATQHNLTRISACSFYRCHPLKGCLPLTAAPCPSSPLCLVSPCCDISS